MKENIFIRILKGLKNYLTDWKNLLGHALVGIFLLVFAIWAPIPGWARILVLLAIITFNVWRMRRDKAKGKGKHGKKTDVEPEAEAAEANEV
ncbi:MAG: hypothetical protein HUJ66_02405 [Oscillospiraceae bacterium]|nr:hypothetical protein [Oscillospiraceae bacterium]